MPRIARVVAIDYPHHVIQRGNRRQLVFFKDSDYRNYLQFLKEHSKKFHIKIISYCLMPNHVHLIVIPEKHSSLADGIGDTHQKYTRMINLRENWRGYLWQGRFSSYVLDENYLYAAVRYILLNPVTAKIVKKAEDYKWSSVRHHMGKEKIDFIEDTILKDMIDNWSTFLQEQTTEQEIDLLRRHENTGRPLGSDKFIEQLEGVVNRNLRKQKPGPKRSRKRKGGATN
ncbi:transposase [Candidatus Omnitrophota bacterium]